MVASRVSNVSFFAAARHVGCPLITACIHTYTHACIHTSAAVMRCATSSTCSAAPPRTAYLFQPQVYCFTDAYARIPMYTEMHLIFGHRRHTRLSTLIRMHLTACYGTQDLYWKQLRFKVHAAKVLGLSSVCSTAPAWNSS